MDFLPERKKSLLSINIKALKAGYELDAPVATSSTVC